MRVNPQRPRIRSFSFAQRIWIAFLLIELSFGFVSQTAPQEKRGIDHLSASVDVKEILIKDVGSAPPSSEKVKKRPLKGSKRALGTMAAPKKTKRQMKKKLKEKRENAETHWLVETDELVLVNATDVNNDHSRDKPSVPALVKFTVRGNPLPLRRHRTNRGFVYNPSAKAQESFRDAVKRLVYPSMDHSLDTTTISPMWGANHTLAATILFRMKRPKKHFVNNKPGPDRLRSTAPRETCSMLRTDVDNLAKFVLDSLNGVLYDDDRQITSLHVTKLYDNDTDQLCQGSTCICLRLLTDDDVPHLLKSSFRLYP